MGKISGNRRAASLDKSSGRNSQTVDQGVSSTRMTGALTAEIFCCWFRRDQESSGRVFSFE